jgi:hypothetical protein
MKEDAIIEGNRTINAFMGYPYNMTESGYPNEVRYHESWDWLMPAVEKVEALIDELHGKFTVNIRNNGCWIESTNNWRNATRYADHVYMSDPNAIFPTKIESTWHNVVQFIKWWNKQPR